jgi:hypothetical protein
MAAAVGGDTLYGGTMYEGPAPGVAVPTLGVPPHVLRGTLEIGKVLSQSFSIYLANFLPFIILTTIALSPALLFSAWASGLQAPAAKLAQSFSTIVEYLCVPIATAPTTYGVFHQMRGSSPTLGECFRVGLATLVPMLGLAIVQGCVVGLASVLCLVPGILLAVRWAVAIPVAVEEHPGVGGALERSSYLTDGYRWQVFGVVAILYILNVVLVGVLAVGLGSESRGFLFASSLLDVFTVGLSATATAVMYYRLRSLKESIDVDQIASVFD